MSAATKRKHVTREVVEEFRLPQPNESIVKVVAGKGNNLHEVADKEGNVFLVSMPTKFRKNVWIKRGDYVFISGISEGDKVKGEITTVLYRDQIKFIKKEGAWPTQFDTQVQPPPLLQENIEESCEADNESDGSDNDDDLFQNTNRRVYDTSESDQETDEEH